MEYKREIEKKFVVEGSDWASVVDYIKTYYTVTAAVQTSHDLYWKAPNVDFIRLRENSRELTVKVTDKGSIIDRVEENAEVAEGSMSTMERLQTLVHGAPQKLTKTFIVAIDSSEDIIICAYYVHGDPLCRVFLEVEAVRLADKGALEDIEYEVELIVKDLLLKPTYQSLYQIFFVEQDKANEA